MAGFLQNHFKSRKGKKSVKTASNLSRLHEKNHGVFDASKVLHNKIKYIHKKPISRLLTVVNEDRKNTVASQVRLIS